MVSAFDTIGSAAVLGSALLPEGMGRIAPTPSMTFAAFRPSAMTASQYCGCLNSSDSNQVRHKDGDVSRVH
jgi:hypothetical protein